MPQQDAEKFLHALDHDEKVRTEVTNSKALTDLAKKHGFHFTNAEMEAALKEKWGHPEKRKGHPEPYTCCCFSTTPGF
ncbi:MAG TPA: hypothetical protein DEQ47_13055 [Solibacterales bacterium]|nr:hypothetical protein [Bryobacterales bacterium]